MMAFVASAAEVMGKETPDGLRSSVHLGRPWGEHARV